MINKYNDIIHLPRHVSKTRPHMSVMDRAAQFSPFAALTGHGAAIIETARLTHERIDLDEGMKVILNNKLQMIAERLKESPEITITYFQPDGNKNGGAYVTTVSTVKKIDQYEQIVVMADGTEIFMHEIISIDGRIFESMCNG